MYVRILHLKYVYSRKANIGEFLNFDSVFFDYLNQIVTNIEFTQFCIGCSSIYEV